MNTIDFYERNILNTYSLAGNVERTEGKHWYKEAKAFAQDLADRAGLPVSTVVGVIAVLSPRVHWERNKHLAEVACLFGVEYLTACLTLSKEKASRILDIGEEPLSVINGAPKTRAFYLNILSGGEDTNVTIDSHAYRLAIGDSKHDGKFSRKEYTRIELAYQRVAEFKQLTPPQLQAITWLVQRQPQRRLI